MMNKRGMTWALVIALTAAVPAFGIFGIPSPDELLIWLVLRPMMHGNQRAMIANIPGTDRIPAVPTAPSRCVRFSS